MAPPSPPVTPRDKYFPRCVFLENGVVAPPSLARGGVLLPEMNICVYMLFICIIEMALSTPPRDVYFPRCGCLTQGVVAPPVWWRHRCLPEMNICLYILFICIIIICVEFFLLILFPLPSEVMRGHR